MSIEANYTDGEDSKGSATDKYGNVLSWQSYPDEGLIEISVNGEELITYCYESDPELVFNDVRTIWEKAQKSMDSPAVNDQEQIERLRHQPVAWRDLKIGEKILPGDRFCNRMYEWVTVTPEHAVSITSVNPGSYPMQRKIGGGDG